MRNYLLAWDALFPEYGGFIFSMCSFSESDLIPGLTTFVCCLIFPLEFGILIGVSVNVLFILYHAARPKITIENLTVS